MIRIMIIDDEPPVLRLMKKMIEETDKEFRVVGEAANGAKALEIIPRIQPDVVITDICMPVVDGLSLVEELKKNHRHIISVIMSAHQDFGYMRKALLLHAEDYLLKPVDIDSLQELLCRLKEKHRTVGSQFEQNIPAPEVAQTGSGKSAESYQEGLAARIEKYLQENYLEAVTLQDIAREFNLAPSYLCTFFKKVKGTTLGDYITKLRIHKAIELMGSNPELMLKNVADRVGYEDPLYFSRVFKKVTGRTPSEYMRDG